MNDYDPKSLPAIDAVEIVDIRRLEAKRVSQYMQIARDEPSVRLNGNAAQRFADAWRALTPGESARCHVPPIGLRFFVDGSVYLEASVCWRCSNLFGVCEENEMWYAFDSDSGAAKRLFGLSQEAIGSEIVGDG